ncbi:MAG: MerR family DNA-binding transcriptional regulator [Gammaproteobacteria bacterium]|nr:MerR family DNA-binding transcriptional regulator [Gammaproteobacteria bacterium]MCB1862416.1 MerR family DNA-binding transcriptional regulator [Gammaproteobacteria bacterium]MCB1873485.1 MerR family DNA-binding transcriptional regulator [Gammaproteobacteria bacterium]MCB1881437.1 MerR family DNA-binding transcriptional regulator [Gammaproteobacteria bacterium]MCB1902604.1 MerR family DNA-binding transcriptional regulator [Gammaproteobacteria bacterium]
MEKLMTITELGDELGLTPRAIRFYESKGLLSPGRVGSNRVYNYRDRARLKLIVRAKRLGFSLSDIAEYLDLYRSDPQQLEQRQLLIAKVRERIAVLEQQKIDLTTTLDELYEIERQATAESASVG